MQMSASGPNRTFVDGAANVWLEAVINIQTFAASDAKCLELPIAAISTNVSETNVEAIQTFSRVGLSLSQCT